ncbi:MAG: ferrous iron transport protein A [Bacteroidia bacterium]|nr:ferrous iron transport protein A [Bacteroidia bacterium]
MNTRKLSELKIGDTATISSIETAEMQVALMNLGVLEGDKCKLTDIAPLGDPIAVLVNGTKVSLRKKDAEKVWVKT